MNFNSLDEAFSTILNNSNTKQFKEISEEEKIDKLKKEWFIKKDNEIENLKNRLSVLIL